MKDLRKGSFLPAGDPENSEKPPEGVVEAGPNSAKPPLRSEPPRVSSASTGSISEASKGSSGFVLPTLLMSEGVPRRGLKVAKRWVSGGRVVGSESGVGRREGREATSVGLTIGRALSITYTMPSETLYSSPVSCTPFAKVFAGGEGRRGKGREEKLVILEIIRGS